MVKLYAAPVMDFPVKMLPSLLNCVGERKEKLIRFHHVEDQIRGLLGDLLIRKLASQALCVPYYNLVFTANAYGKPFLSGGGLEFNISHSGDWVVCAIGQQPIGIDIEKIGDVDLELAHRFFARDEYEYIKRSSDAEQRRERFYSVWSAKESLIKAVGQGLSLPLDSFSVVSGDTIVSQLTIFGVVWNLERVFLNPMYSLCVCAEETDLCEPLEVINMQWLIDGF